MPLLQKRFKDWYATVWVGSIAIYFFGGLEDTGRKLCTNLRNLNSAFDITLLTKRASRRILHGNGESDEDDYYKEIRNALRALESDVTDYLHPFLSCYDFEDPEDTSGSDL